METPKITVNEALIIALGTIENLNNKLKTLSNDIRTISES